MTNNTCMCVIKNQTEPSKKRADNKSYEHSQEIIQLVSRYKYRFKVTHFKIVMRDPLEWGWRALSSYFLTIKLSRFYIKIYHNRTRWDGDHMDV